MSEEAGTLLTKAGLGRPAALQQRILPLILAHRDVAVEAPPGSDRTVTMLVSVLLMNRKAGTGAMAAMLVPDEGSLREAQRLWKSLARAAASPLSFAALGIEDGVRKEARLLEARPQVIVATPQRLIDHIRQNNVDLSGVRFLCIDTPSGVPEFHRDVEFILSKCPADRQVVVFLPEGEDEGVAHLGGGRQQVVLKRADWWKPEPEPEPEAAPVAARRSGGSGRRTGPAHNDGRDVVSKGTEGQSLEATIKGYLERIGQADAAEMRRLTGIVRRSVPFHLRSALAAYLLREITGVAPVAEDGKLARLFINAGRNRRIFPNDIYDLFISQLHIQRSDFGEVRVLDNYSFVEIQSRYAERAIAQLTGKDLRGRKLTVNYARPREDKQRE